MSGLISALRRRTGTVCTILTNSLLTRLRNGRAVNLTREEFRHCVLSFGQFGEDLIVQQLLQARGIQRGIYVDVGAYDPVMFSNTLLLWKSGFQGVNIDMNAEKIRNFQQARPRDYNVCAAVANGSFAFEAVNAGDTTEAVRIVADGKEGPRTATLDEILAASPYAGRPIDYLNIDCEGHDLDVLRSLSLDVYRPAVITIEALDAASGDATRRHLESAGYVLHGTACVTRIFSRAEPAA